MVFKELEGSNISKYYPWNLSSSELQPNILLMCKMLIALLLFNGFYLKINDPYLPFIRWFDVFNDISGIFKNSLQFGFVLFGFMLFFNIKTKLSSLILGLIVILTLLASKPLFRNHIFIVGCVLFLVGLSKNSGLPWLIILQISLVYIGASLNKALQIDWWTGQFMDNWLRVASDNEIYHYLSSVLPDLWLAKLMSWLSILVELTIGITLLTKKWRVLGIWLMIIFHFAMVTMLALRFGHFVQDLFIILIAFLNWPHEKVVVKYIDNKSILRRRIIRFLDWNKMYLWYVETKNMNGDFDIENYGKYKSNYTSFVFMLLYCEGFYVLLFLFDFVAVKLIEFYEPISIKIFVHLIFCTVIWGLILLFFPISFKNRSKRYVDETQF